MTGDPTEILRKIDDLNKSVLGERKTSNRSDVQGVRTVVECHGSRERVVGPGSHQ